MRKLGSLTLALALLAVPLPAAAACGDGILETATEGCDDSNTVDGDGCSATCNVETGFSCATQPRVDVVNPSFEMDPFPSGGGLTGGGWTRLSVADVDWVTGVCWPAGDGSHSIDMNGSDRQGTMYQTLTTVAGQHYVMTFLGSANPADGAAGTCTDATMKNLTIRVADGSDYRTAVQARVLTLVRAAVVSDWRLYTYEFDALSTTTTLVFEGSAASFNGPMIDRIAIPASICTLDTCGNGTRAGSEACDDGNNDSGDGCSAFCVVEPGYDCGASGTTCVAASCGDGIVASPEICDDRNVIAGDGCSATCTMEPGWLCRYVGTLARSVCQNCGNGTLEGNEVCDDNNAIDHDACSNTCLLGPGEPCGSDGECDLGMCHPAGFHCTGCYDTAGPGMTDFNCTSGGPICDTSAPFPLCVGCVVDEDCSATDVCNPLAHACNPGVRPDAGVDASTTPDAGRDAGSDAGSDGGNVAVDAGSDAGRDAGSDASSTLDGGPITGGASGGACACSMHERAAGTAWRLLVGLGVLALIARRQRRARR